MVAGCDREILGSVLSDGEFQVKVSERFYGGEVVDWEKLMEHIEDATIVNLMGDRIVGLAVSEGIVDENCVKNVCGVKHAQMITLQE